MIEDIEMFCYFCVKCKEIMYFAVEQKECKCQNCERLEKAFEFLTSI